MEDLLKTPNAGKILKRSASWMEKEWCSGRSGIPFIRIGRSIFYARPDLERWLQGQTRHLSTSEYPRRMKP